MKCFGHTPKHPFPQRRDLNFSLKCENSPLDKHKVALTTNSVSHIITPPIFIKSQTLRPQEDHSPQMPTHSTSLRAQTIQAQASLVLSIPNYIPSRQGKSLSYILAYLVDITVEKCNEKAVKPIHRVSHTAPLSFNLKPLIGCLNDEHVFKDITYYNS